MSLKQFGQWLVLKIAPPLAALLIRLIALLVRKETIGAQSARQMWQRSEAMILSLWHDQLLLIPMGYEGPGAQILISRSHDGELIARTVQHLGYNAVRGSSSRGGSVAFKQLLRLTKQPYDLGITPDGPRGPRHAMKDGVVQLARLSGRAVVPVALVSSRGHRFASWDRFLLPYPFGRLVYSYGEPLYCARDDDPEQFKVRLQQAMVDNHSRAQARLESYGLSAV
ncbi:MAG: lysophospholipid acyltransferase family protein [Thermodesulfobacteriota bacterium]|nr:lysophospholipid acyltransferase family protein [Thermodesulfobacteriota bacterium]